MAASGLTSRTSLAASGAGTARTTASASSVAGEGPHHSRRHVRPAAPGHRRASPCGCRLRLPPPRPARRSTRTLTPERGARNGRPAPDRSRPLPRLGPAPAVRAAGCGASTSASASCGVTARRLRWSASPALMPPTSGPTRRSSTSSPNRARMAGRPGSSPASARGSSGSTAARALPRHDSRRERAIGHSRGRCAEHEPRGQAVERAAGPDVGRQVAGATRSPASPTARARSTAAGERARNMSAPHSTLGSPAKGWPGPCRPAGRPPPSTVTSAPSPAGPARAAARPVMPPPTTATCARSAPASGRHARARADRPEAGQGVHDGGSSLTQAVRPKASPRRSALPRRLDVEVVQHLEVIGDEPAGAHQQPGPALGGQRRR